MAASDPDLPPVALTIDGRTLTCRALAPAGAGPIRVVLHPDALDRVTASHAVAAQALARRAVYGRSTGVGANRGISIDGRPDHAPALLRSHATAGGPLRGDGRVRAMLVVRLNQLAAGGSGISPAVVHALADLIDRDALPSTRELGGLGTGDLAALASAALGLAGEPALTHPAGPPVTFGVHDALPFLSSSAATLADMALACRRLRTLAEAATTVAGLSAVALGANLEAYGPPVRRRLPGRGGAQVCRVVTGLYPARPGPAARLQDPLGLRCLPAVHGCALDALAALESATDALLNVAGENPLVLAPPDQGDDQDGEQDGGDHALVHHGLFHLAGLALAADAAAIGLAQSGPLLLSRLGMFNAPALTGLPPFLADGTPGSSGVMLLEYVAAAALAELRAAATPASLGTVSLSRGTEEDHSFASQAAVQLLRAAPAYTTAVAAELVAAVRALRMSASTLAAGPWQDVLDLCQDLPAGVHDRDLTEDVLIAERLLPRLAGPDDRGDPIPAGHA